jgi:hypothetical protein
MSPFSKKVPVYTKRRLFNARKKVYYLSQVLILLWFLDFEDVWRRYHNLRTEALFWAGQRLSK